MKIRVVKYGKISREIDETGLSNVGSLKVQLLASFEEELKGTDIAKDDITLVAGGKKLVDSISLKDVVSSKFTMIASQKISDEELSFSNRNRVRDDLNTNSSSAPNKKNVQELSKDSQFHQLETLSFLPYESRAKDILVELANDLGVINLMKKRNWHVGTLAEMFPEGEVGISEVCVLGLNQNKGQKILLRLRTDDLNGFRNMTTIRKVLFHELAHNDFSEHDDNFFTLMRQVEKESIEMNWTKSSSRSIGGTVFDTYQENGSTEEHSSVMISGPQILDPDSNNAHRNLPARLLAGTAANYRRRSEEEIEVEGGCECEAHRNRNSTLLLHDKTCLVCEKSEIKTSETNTEEEVLSSQKEETSSLQITTQIVNMNWETLENSAKVILENFDQSIAVCLSTDFCETLIEKLLELRDALSNLLHRNGREYESKNEVLSVFSLLSKITKNARSNVNKRSINTITSKTYRFKIKPDKYAEKILVISGFVYSTSEPGILKYSRNDTSLLYIVDDIIENVCDELI